MRARGPINRKLRAPAPFLTRTGAAAKVLLRPVARGLGTTALKVLVCGGREWGDAELVESTLDRLHAARGPFSCLITGGARGVDRIAGKWARKNGVLEWDFLPEWHRAGTPDGSMRNQRMIAEGAPDLVIAFPGGLGTADMVERAKAAGVEVVESQGGNP
jgi:predicted Rossmann-fold nucleotide-binding protein